MPPQSTAQKLLSGRWAVGEGGPYLPNIDTRQPPKRKYNGLHGREARDGGSEKKEEGGEEGRDGAVQEAQAGPPKHQQQGQDLQAGIL